MPHILLKETVKKDIEISFKSICSVIDLLSAREKKLLLKRLQSETMSFTPHKKDKISAVVSDFAKTNLYEDAFLKDLEAGLKKSSVYR
jgi:hypothetical protein